MGRHSKWAASFNRGSPFSLTAKRIIRERLEDMWHYLPKASKRAEDDVEYVHQLRVSSRRTASALRVFGDLLPHEKLCRLKRMVRKVRRAANDARDLDVLLGNLVEMNTGGELKPLIRQVKQRRKQAQKPLRRLYKTAKSKYWKRRSMKFVKKVHWRGIIKEPSLREGATSPMRRAVDDFFTAANADLTDIEAIHQMRIRGKHLRYTMELLVGAFDKAFRKELYPVFSSVQERLGEINDHATATKILEAWKSRTDSRSVIQVLDQMIKREEELLDSTADAFRQWWTPGRARELVQRFDAFLNEERMHRAGVDRDERNTSRGENGQPSDGKLASPKRREVSQ